MVDIYRNTREESLQTINSMKTIVTLLVGFWLGRQFYINHELKTLKKKKKHADEQHQSK